MSDKAPCIQQPSVAVLQQRPAIMYDLSQSFSGDQPFLDAAVDKAKDEDLACAAACLAVKP